MNIRTSFDNPPIPVRSMDWSAVDDNYEPGQPIGRGRTELEAIADLLAQLNPDDSPTFPQSSSLVSQGAESADIGKLDTADESGKVNRVEEKVMTVSEWKERYIQTIVDNSKVSREEAEQCYEACEQPIDLTDDPEDSAMTEMSYWED